MTFFLGIDGGGSKTRCLLGDEDSVIASGSSSASNIVRVGEACAQDSLTSAVHEACVQAKISPRDIARTCLGAAGAVRPEISGALRRIMKNVIGGDLEITGDMEIAFEDAFGQAPGIIVIAGTGSIAYGRNARGQTLRVGGWGYAISDEGSGHWVGVEAVKAALHACDRGEDPQILAELMPAVGAATFDEFIVRMNGDPAPDFSALFPVVLAAAQNSDALALDILHNAGARLAALAHEVTQRLFADEAKIQVATHGGVFASNAEVKESFSQKLKSLVPAVTLLVQKVDPARGALERARRTSISTGAHQP